MPVVRRGVFASSDGEVVEVVAKSGQMVKAGDLLVRMKNDELRAKLLQHRNLLADKRQQMLAVDSQLSQSSTPQTPATEIELHGKLQQLKVEIEGTKQLVESITQQVEALTVRSPIEES